MREIINRKYRDLIHGESGFTMLEVVFSSAIMVIVGLAYLGSLSQSISISQVFIEQNQANVFIEREIEALKNTKFEEVPYRQTSPAEKLTEVPDYFDDIAVADMDPTKPGFVGTSSEQTGYEAYHLFDGIRTGEPDWKRWMCQDNGPVKGGGFVPQTEDPIIINDPGTPGGGTIIINPGDSDITREINSDSHYAYVAFTSKVKIHRIIYDNRFNVRGDDLLPQTDIDYRDRRDSIWQRDYQIFISEDEDITKGVPFQPDFHSSKVIYDASKLCYGTTGVLEVFNDVVEPLEPAILGVANISVETDFDSTYHYPYGSELEAYGFKAATYFVDSYTFTNGEVDLGNYIMFMPKYLGSTFDLFRRVYIKEGEGEFPPTVGKLAKFNIQIEIYPHDERRNTSTFVKSTWWQDDKKELMSFRTTFTRDKALIYDNLPGLQNLPQHTYYYNNEDIHVAYTIPGASKLRAHFNIFTVQAYPDTDYLQFYDKNGTQYGELQYWGKPLSPAYPGDPELPGGFSPWINGDTMVLHFTSDDALSSIPNTHYGGFNVDYVEIK